MVNGWIGFKIYLVFFIVEIIINMKGLNVLGIDGGGMKMEVVLMDENY